MEYYWLQQNTELKLDTKRIKNDKNRKVQKRKYNDSFDFEQYSNSDSVQFSDSNQVLYKIQLDINKEFKKIEKNIDLKKTNKEVVSKKPEKNKITNEEFKTKENQEKIEV